MVKLCRAIILAAACGILMGLQQAALAQVKNPQALVWFNQGVQEKDPNKKIEAYKKAIEIEPDFMEAMYNLGLVYEKLGNWEQTIYYLNKAYTVRRKKITADLKLKILYKLALANKRLGRFKDSEEALRQAMRLTKDKIERGMIALELGRVLYEQGLYRKALTELHQGLNITPTFRVQFMEMIEKCEQMILFQDLYEQGKQAFERGEYQQARALFQQIYIKNKDYRNVAKRLAELDSILLIEKEKSSRLAALQQALKYEEEGKLELAIALYENLLQKQDDPEIRLRLKNVQEKLQENQKLSELQAEYEIGMKALRARNWAAAIYSFEKIMNIDPEFRDARRRLNEARRGLENENIERLLDDYYTQALSALNLNDYERAEIALRKVIKLNPRYLDAQALLDRIEAQKLKSSGEPQSSLLAATAVRGHLDSLYSVALGQLDQGQYTEALVVLEKIRLIDPEYQNVIDLIAEARAKLQAASLTPEAPAAKSGNKSTYSAIFWGGVFVSLLVLPVVGLFLFSPTVRARYYILRGNYAGAAQIYEKLLEKNPGRLKLYSVLADLYLLLGRRDEKALNLFKTIMRLNLNTPKQNEINAVLTQNYLQEGKTDDDAIQILEAALKKEIEGRRELP